MSKFCKNEGDLVVLSLHPLWLPAYAKTVKVYLAILLFFVSALMFVRLNSNICLGCQNNGSQIVNNTLVDSNQNPTRFQLISKRFLGQGNSNYNAADSSYNAPTRLDRSTATVVSPRSLSIDTSTQQMGSQRSLGSSVSSNFNRMVNRLPLRNLGRSSNQPTFNQNNTELTRNTNSVQQTNIPQTAPNTQQQYTQQQSQRLLRNLGFNGNNTIEQDLQTTTPTTNSTTQLRNLNNNRGNTTSSLNTEQTRTSTQQLRQLPGTFDNVPRVLNPIIPLATNSITSANSQSNLTDLATDTIQARPESLERDASTNDSEVLEPLAKEAADYQEGAVHNFSNNELQIPLMVPENSASTIPENLEEIANEVGEEPKLLDPLPTVELPEVETTKDTQSIIDRVLTSFGASNTSSNNDVATSAEEPIRALQTNNIAEETETATNNEPEASEINSSTESEESTVSSNNESDVIKSSEDNKTTNSETTEVTESETVTITAPENTQATEVETTIETSGTDNSENTTTENSSKPVLAAPLETVSDETSANSNASSQVTIETETTEPVPTPSSDEDTTVAGSSAQIPTTESSATESSTTETTETQSTESTESTVTKVEITTGETESEELQPELNEDSTSTNVLAPALSPATKTETENIETSEATTDTVEIIEDEATTENLPEASTESTTETSSDNSSDNGTTNILLPNLDGILPNQNIAPITPDPDSKPEDSQPEENKSTETEKEETTTEDITPEETTNSETSKPEEAITQETDSNAVKPEENTEVETPNPEEAIPTKTEPVETPTEETPTEETPTEETPTEETPTEETEPVEGEETTAPVPSETPEVVIEKIALEDIAVDSEIDYWNAYFAKNAKSYDDLVAQSKEQDSPLLIVDAMQGESGTVCDLDNPCSLFTAISKLKTGGTILIREGDYELRQRINITRSGTEASPIVIRNYPEEEVMLSGKRLSGSSADAGLINISDQQHIRIQGLELTNYSSSKSFGTVAAIMLRRSASNIEIIQNHIHDIRTLAPKNNTSALGIAIYGTSPTKPMKDILIQGNHVHDLTLGFSESISLSGNVDGFRIEGNQVHDVDNIGIVVAGGYGTACWESANRNSCDDSLDYARNGLVMGNTVYNVDTRKNSAYPDNTVNAAAGIYVDGARTIVVERNRVYSNGSGLSVSSENAGGLAKDIIVRNNLIYNNHRTGMNLGAENAQKGRVDNLTVTNNTFYNNDLSPQWGGEIFMEFDVDNSLITNNIFYADNYIYDAGNDVDLDINLIINDGLPPEVSGSEDNKLVKNIYHGKGINRTWQWQGKWYNHESFEAFLEASGDKLDEVEGSFDADPGFAFLPDTPDEQVELIRLEPSLINPPSKNRAFPLSASIVGELDKAANPRLNDDALDIGAYEH